MIRYNVDPSQQPIREMVAAFAEKHIAPISKELDHRDDPDRFAQRPPFWLMTAKIRNAG